MDRTTLELTIRRSLLTEDDTSIVDFRFKHRFLSNFHLAEVQLEGIEYPSSEHAYQAAKTLDPIMRETISKCGAPAVAKKIGKTIDLRADWEQVKFGIMQALVREKFTRHADLRAKLQETGSAALIEGNWWHDTYWGKCTCVKHSGTGQNNLGKILMQVRAEL